MNVLTLFQHRTTGTSSLSVITLYLSADMFNSNCSVVLRKVYSDCVNHIRSLTSAVKSVLSTVLSFIPVPSECM
jgi:hypothetical protein